MKRLAVIFLLLQIVHIGLIGCNNSKKTEKTEAIKIKKTIKPSIKTPQKITGLVGYWKFDGNANDESENNNHGKWVGKEEYRDDGVFGKAAYFDGISNYVSIPHSPSIKDIGKEAFSLGIWINSMGKSNNKNQHFFNKRAGGIGINWDIYLSATSENINVEMASNSLGNPKSNMKINEWYHLFLIRHSSGDTDIYIDGKPLASKSIPGDSSNTHPLGIGNLEGALDQGFAGRIDEVVLFNRALSYKEIADLINITTTNIQP